MTRSGSCWVAEELSPGQWLSSVSAVLKLVFWVFLFLLSCRRAEVPKTPQPSSSVLAGIVASAGVRPPGPPPRNGEAVTGGSERFYLVEVDNPQAPSCAPGYEGSSDWGIEPKNIGGAWEWVDGTVRPVSNARWVDAGVESGGSDLMMRTLWFRVGCSSAGTASIDVTVRAPGAGAAYELLLRHDAAGWQFVESRNVWIE